MFIERRAFALVCALPLCACTESPPAEVGASPRDPLVVHLQCGDRSVQDDEECELGAVSDGSRGLPEGTPYDVWSCDPGTCKRRYIYTPCSGVGWDREECLEGFCDGSLCRPVDRDGCKSWTLDSPVVSCEIAGRWRGLCGLDQCFPRCQEDEDCPPNATCGILYAGEAPRVCLPHLPE